MVDFDDIKRDLAKGAQRDPRREGREEPPPQRPPLAGIVAGQVQAGKRNAPPPPPVHATRPQQRTQTAMPAPPAPGSAPQPPPSAPPRSISPPPVSVPTSQAERELAEVRAELQDARELVLRLSAEAGKPPSVVYGEAPWWWTAKGVAAVLTAGATFLGAVTLAIVQIIGAAKQPSVADATLRELVAERDQRKNGKALEDKLEEAARAERQRKDDQFAAALRDLDLRYPAPKNDPARPPN